MPASLLPRATAAALALSLGAVGAAYTAPDPAQGKGNPDQGSSDLSSAKKDKGKDKDAKGKDKDKDKGKGKGPDDTPGNGNGNNGLGNGNGGPVDDVPGQPDASSDQGSGDDTTTDTTPTTTTTTSTAPAGSTTVPTVAPAQSTAEVSQAVADAPGLALGKKVGVAELRGDVVVRAPGADAAKPLDSDAAVVPAGTVVDAREGAIALATVVSGGEVQVGRFSGGIFEVRQAAGGVTQIVLRHGDFDQCDASTASTRAVSGPTASAAKGHGTPIRSLWGSDHNGRFQTRGRGSVATVRGTKWGTIDYCDGTLTKVTKGAVLVHDIAKHRSVLVKAGHSYFARSAS